MRRHFAMVSLLLAGCASSPAAPQLLAVEPTQFDGEIGTALVLRGSQLVPLLRFDFDTPSQSQVLDAGVSAFLTDVNGERVELFDVQWVDATQVTARVEGPIATGAWNVHLVEPRGSELVLNEALLALQCTDDGDCLYPDGGLVDAGTPCAQSNYRDRDNDGFGAGGAQNRCGLGFVSRNGDCDDRDNLSYPGAREVCNGLDDDCDGTVDVPSCSDGGWTRDDSLLSASNDFTAATVVERGVPWVATNATVFVVSDGGFVERSTACPAGITAIAGIAGSDVELSGTRADGGTLLRVTQSGCSGARLTPAPLVAMLAFPGVTAADFVGVTEKGDVWRWRAGEPPLISTSNLANARIRDAHGISKSQLMAVGSSEIDGTRRARAWVLGADGGWQEERPLGSSSSSWTKVELAGVWALSGTSAVAVGDNGTVVVRSSSGWRRAWNDSFDDLTSVRAFSSTRYYVTTDEGRVRLRHGWSWDTVFRASPQVPLRELAGTAEDDLWAVGNDGTIVRSAH
ncbi:MAG: putative metal-binding motif-containing protein [Archangium sp.]